MSRDIRTGCLAAADWEAYLQPLASENRTWQSHLEVCPECRQTLVGLAGEVTWWNEAQQWLEPATEPDLQDFVGRVSESVCALAADGRCGEAKDPLRDFEIQQLQQLLAPASHPELLGRIGRYELEQLVGRGGMGLVFLARDIELHRVVAVKTLAVHLIPIAAARERFIREGRASAALVHPHIVPVYDVITDGSIPALVMQFVKGPTLEAWLGTRGSLPWTEVLQIAIQLADALAAAHGHGLVHRDVKPGNVLLEADGSRALLTDFGLVRALDEATLTRSGMLAGTPDYMSPEQARGEAVLQTSDLFSLGSVLYAMLTGHPPFRASDPMAVMNRICHEPHRNLSTTHPEIPQEVCRMVDRLLAKEPKRRFASANELREHLQHLALSPLHLRSRSRMPRIALYAIAACASLFLVGLTVWTSNPKQTAQQGFSERSLPTPSSRPAPDLEPTSLATDGFPDLKTLESSVWQLDQQVQALFEDVYGTVQQPSFDGMTTTTSIDRRFDHESDLLEQLESEMWPDRQAQP